MFKQSLKSMAEETGISWTDASWNPWHGCIKVSDGCKNCYMYRDKERYGQDPMLVVRGKTTFNAPLKWKEPKMIFTCSWSDWFIEHADPWRNEAWDIIKNTPQHTYQILTKRPERILANLPEDWGAGYPNVWLGISAEHNAALLKRMADFSSVKAKVKFISIEPLLAPVNSLEDVLRNGGIDWVIVGGESGNLKGKYRFRFCAQNWIEDVVNTCKDNHTPVFIKQLGSYIANEKQLRSFGGHDIKEFPKSLQVREFPKNYKS